MSEQSNDRLRLRPAPAGSAPKHPPLYHYTDAAGLIGILQDGKLRASHAQFLNDSLELKHGREVAQKIFERLGDVAGKPADNLAWVSTLATVFLTSFSQKGDLLSQWRAYVDNGLGYAIGFESSLALRFEDRAVEVLQVEYGREAQERLVEEAASNHEGLKPFDTLIPRLKNAGFEEESEWRAIVPFLFFGTDYVPPMKFVPSRYGVKPFIELEAVSSIDGRKLPIFEIVMGPRLEPRVASMALGYLLKARGYGYSMLASEDEEIEEGWIRIRHSKASYR